jgi:hypothetical protein
MATRARVKRFDPMDSLMEFVAKLEEKTGFKLPSTTVIPDCMAFRQWCEKLAVDGMKVDGQPFRLDDRPAMCWVYDQIPNNADEAYRYILVIMKCAQVGFTVMEILAALYLGIKFGPCTVGMFLPDMNLAGIKSTERFMPIVRSIPPVHALMKQDAADGSGRKSGEGNVNKRRLDDALYIFSWTSGRSTTESIPMDVLNFDEVQNMTVDQIEKTYERLSASKIRFMLMGSTAKYPEADIHHWYLRGTQHRFHTECPTCGAAKPLDDYFPKCIKFDTVTDRYRYVCESGHWIDDPQIGQWIADMPEADRGVEMGVAKINRRLRIRSLHFPQFLSPTISPDEIITAYGSAQDMQNFYNRKLGKPFLDPSQIPVSLAHCAACVAEGMRIGLQWKTRARDTYMGIDQMGNFNVHVIKERLPDGRQAVIHVEETYSDDPFARSDELMRLYGVAVCVVEINPNYNEAKRFANRHPGKVFICNSFGTVDEGMIQWGDAPKLDTSDRRTTDEDRDRYTLRMDQYKCMQVSMARITGVLCLFPDPQGLFQEVPENDRMTMVAILPRTFHHFTKTALVAERDEETNKYKKAVKKIGIDPHFSYANMLCDVAWARSHGTTTFMIPNHTSTENPMVETKNLGLEIIRDKLDDIKADANMKQLCGNCISYDDVDGMCMQRWFKVRSTDVGCPLWVRKD